MSHDLTVLSTIEQDPINLGKTGRVFEGLDAFKLSQAAEHVGVLQKVIFTSNELMAYCPVTSQPDLYKVTIELEPWKHTIETKSLKLYIESFRETAILAEDLAVKIAIDLFKASRPFYVGVTLQQNVRGGIQLTAKAVRNIEEDMLNE